MASEDDGLEGADWEKRVCDHLEEAMVLIRVMRRRFPDDETEGGRLRLELGATAEALLRTLNRPDASDVEALLSESQAQAIDCLSLLYAP